LERQLVVDLAAEMEPNKTTRLKAPSYSHCILVVLYIMWNRKSYCQTL